MTKKISTKHALSKIYCRGVAHEEKKQRFGTILLSAPNVHPPQRRKFDFCCCLAVSDDWRLAIRVTNRNRNEITRFGALGFEANLASEDS